jgi:hypothetical protein
MNKSRYNLNTFTLSELRSQIAIKLCFPINGKSDCEKFSEILLIEGYGSVSSTTLYRLFVNYDGGVPYAHTLNVLVKYIGYPSWNSFIEAVNNANEFDFKVINKQQNTTNGLLYQCIIHEANAPLFAYFESLQSREFLYKSMVALEVYDCLRQLDNPEVFFSTFKSDRFIKEFVLEFAFDPAFRIKNYKKAFELQLIEFSKVNSAASLQDFVFYHTVLFRHYYLKPKWNKALTIGTKIYSAIAVDSTSLEDIFIFPKMRFKAYKIWHMQLIGASKHKIEDYILGLFEYAKIIYPTIGSYERRVIFHCIAEVFCHSEVDCKYHLHLKEIFKNEFDLFPSNLFDKSIKEALPYFEANGLLHYRPLEKLN